MSLKFTIQDLTPFSFYNLVKSSLSESAKLITFYRIAFRSPEHFKELVRRTDFLRDINRNLLFEEQDYELISGQYK